MRHCPALSFLADSVPFWIAFRIAGRPFLAHAAVSLNVMSGMVPNAFTDYVVRV